MGCETNGKPVRWNIHWSTFIHAPTADEISYEAKQIGQRTTIRPFHWYSEHSFESSRPTSHTHTYINSTFSGTLITVHSRFRVVFIDIMIIILFMLCSRLAVIPMVSFIGPLSIFRSKRGTWIINHTQPRTYVLNIYNTHINCSGSIDKWPWQCINTAEESNPHRVILTTSYSPTPPPPSLTIHNSASAIRCCHCAFPFCRLSFLSHFIVICENAAQTWAMMLSTARRRNEMIASKILHINFVLLPQTSDPHVRLTTGSTHYTTTPYRIEFNTITLYACNIYNYTRWHTSDMCINP